MCRRQLIARSAWRQQSLFRTEKLFRGGFATLVADNNAAHPFATHLERDHAEEAGRHPKHLELRERKHPPVYERANMERSVFSSLSRSTASSASNAWTNDSASLSSV